MSSGYVIVGIPAAVSVALLSLLGWWLRNRRKDV